MLAPALSRAQLSYEWDSLWLCASRPLVSQQGHIWETLEQRRGPMVGTACMAHSSMGKALYIYGAICTSSLVTLSGAMAQLAKGLLHKPEGPRFNPPGIYVKN